MLLKRYLVQVVEPTVKAALIDSGRPTYWLITANDLPGAWRKFTKQHFGVLLPTPCDYDITFHDTRSV